ncbi:unnamed protein product [Clavelina lepadiformis]|uniref:E3 ubiquitin-protein ligase TM129 n=1 Tax=Clavelina lepadiformis TaxID=159417 RepID=A0ABP0GFI5_CLALP
MTSVNPAIAFSFFYWLIALLFVASPTEFQTSGLTVQRIFRRWLGSESNDFTFYHIKRTAATILFHASLPLGYFFGMTFVSESKLTFFRVCEGTVHIAWQIYLLCSLALALVMVGVVYYWSLEKWKNHPISKMLLVYSNSFSDVAMQINAEFRSIDKYTSGDSYKSRVIVTDNWLIKTHTYSVSFIQQDHLRLVVRKTEQFQVSPETMATVQFVNLKVTCLKRNKSFIIRILSTEYIDFKEKLRVSVFTLPNIRVHTTSVELFLEVFREHVVQNPLYVVHADEELGDCIGCDQKPVEIKLLKQCADMGDGECENCRCRPMWCMECMARWYASRQDQSNPGSWLVTTSCVIEDDWKTYN